MAIESIKKIRTKGKLEMKNLGTQTGNSEASLMNKIQEVEERISGPEDVLE